MAAVIEDFLYVLRKHWLTLLQRKSEVLVSAEIGNIDSAVFGTYTANVVQLADKLAQRRHMRLFDPKTATRKCILVGNKTLCLENGQKSRPSDRI